MKKLFFFIALIALVACNKDEDDEPDGAGKIEYRIWTSVDGAGVKYMDAKGEEVFAIMSDTTEWVMSFTPEIELDSVGFKLKDYITWCTYKIVINTDTVVNYTGPIPDGGFAGWYEIYYQL